MIHDRPTDLGQEQVGQFQVPRLPENLEVSSFVRRSNGPIGFGSILEVDIGSTFFVLFRFVLFCFVLFFVLFCFLRGRLLGPNPV